MAVRDAAFAAEKDRIYAVYAEFAAYLFLEDGQSTASDRDLDGTGQGLW